LPLPADGPPHPQRLILARVKPRIGKVIFHRPFFLRLSDVATTSSIPADADNGRLYFLVFKSDLAARRDLHLDAFDSSTALVAVLASRLRLREGFNSRNARHSLFRLPEGQRLSQRLRPTLFKGRARRLAEPLCNPMIAEQYRPSPF